MALVLQNDGLDLSPLSMSEYEWAICYLGVYRSLKSSKVPL